MNNPLSILVREITKLRGQGVDTSGLGGVLSALQRTTFANVAQQATLHKAAYTDAATGLLNRRGGDEALHKLFETTRHVNQGDNQQTVVVMFFDIDHFKSVNDTYGHDVGDKTIKAVADAAKRVFPGDDAVVARMGGEEFMVAFACPRAACIETAEVKAEALRVAIGGTYIHKTEKTTAIAQSGERNITASIGVAMLQPDRRHAKRVDDTLFNAKKRADAALYHAKQNGRDRVAFYDRMPQAAAAEVEALATRPSTAAIPASPAPRA